MAKQPELLYRCPKCSHESAQWFAKCPSRTCGEFVTPIEVAPAATRKGQTITAGTGTVTPASFRPIGEAAASAYKRTVTGIGELDRVLGGGIVPGSYMMLAGAPGAGKSTLSADLLIRLNTLGGNVRYVSGEESEAQIKMRFDRVKTSGDSPEELTGRAAAADAVPFSSETSADRVAEAILSASNGGEPIDLIVVDSIQTLFCEEVAGAPGGIAQVRESGERLRKAAKTSGTSVLLIGQVLKDGEMAGPKTLEHMVDVVMQFEGDHREGTTRILRAVKNRFGSTDEIGVFDMTEKGLIGIPDPSELFVPQRTKPVPGTVTCAVLEGSRPVLCEVQALVNPNDRSPMPTRSATGIDRNRLSMLIAVMSRKLGYPLGSMDIFVNVAGGLKVTETAADLAVCIALASALKKQPVRERVCVAGEVSLPGEVRPVSQSERRQKEAVRLGYEPLPYRESLAEVIKTALSGTVMEEGIDGTVELHEA